MESEGKKGVRDERGAREGREGPGRNRRKEPGGKGGKKVIR